MATLLVCVIRAERPVNFEKLILNNRTIILLLGGSVLSDDLTLRPENKST